MKACLCHLSIIDDISCNSVGGERDQDSTTYVFEGANELIKNASGTEHSNTPPVGFESDPGKNTIKKSTIHSFSFLKTVIDVLFVPSVSGSASSCTTENFVNLVGASTEEPGPVKMQFVSKLICQNSVSDMLNESVVSSPTLPLKKYSTENRIIYPHIGCFSSNANCSPVDIPALNGFTSSASSSACASIAVVNTANSFGSEVSNSSTLDSNLEHMEVSVSLNSVEFARNFHEGYCNVSDLDDCRELTEAVTDVDSISSHCERGKSEDGDNDDLLGGVFVYSEGISLNCILYHSDRISLIVLFMLC